MEISEFSLVLIKIFFLSKDGEYHHSFEEKKFLLACFFYYRYLF